MKEQDDVAQDVSLQHFGEVSGKTSVNKLLVPLQTESSSDSGSNMYCKAACGF